MPRSFLAALAAATLFATPSLAALVVDNTTIGQSVFVTSTNDVIATFESSEALFSSDLYLDSPSGFAGVIFNNQSTAPGTTVNLGSYAIGTELIFRLYVNDTLTSFFTGPGSRNPDGFPHAAVNTDGGGTFVGFEDADSNGGDFNDLIFSFTNTVAAPSTVPEPAAWGLMIVGLGGVGAVLRRRRESPALA